MTAVRPEPTRARRAEASALDAADLRPARATVPPLAAGLIARRALVDRLMRVRGASLALLLAPAGHGKTTLLTEWAFRDSRPFAWLRLHERDDDPVELLRSLARALSVL